MGRCEVAHHPGTDQSRIHAEDADLVYRQSQCITIRELKLRAILPSGTRDEKSIITPINKSHGGARSNKNSHFKSRLPSFSESATLKPHFSRIKGRLIFGARIDYHSETGRSIQGGVVYSTGSETESGKGSGLCCFEEVVNEEGQDIALD